MDTTHTIIEIPPTLIPNFLASCEELTFALRQSIPGVTQNDDLRFDADAILAAVENIEVPFGELTNPDGRLTMHGGVLLTRYIAEHGLKVDYSGDDSDAHK